MATADAAALPSTGAATTPRTSRRHPFSALVKKFADFTAGTSGRRKGHQPRLVKNHPYGPSLPAPAPANSSVVALDTSLHTLSIASADHHPHAARSSPSAALTASADGRHTSLSLAAVSHGASSLAGTSRSACGIDSGRGDSTFSSPALSERSLTTTLTTVQTLATTPTPHSLSATTTVAGVSASLAATPQHFNFSQPFPPSPASALPPYLSPSGFFPGHPTTYSTATANNLLTDNASTLTLASSSKRHRRRSLDTDASVRALAPSSLWGGSRESLPLSVLSANIDPGPPGTTAPGLPLAASRVSAAGAERNSVYSFSGVGTGGISPALPPDLASLYARQPSAADASSIRSGLGHGRTDSATALPGCLANPREEYPAAH